MSNMEQKTDIEEPMKFLYQTFHGIDPDDCIAFEGDARKLEIILENSKQNLLDFLIENTQVITFDFFSSKEILDEIIGSLPEQERKRYETLYMGLEKFWGVVKYQNKTVGVANKVAIYNGFPNFVDPFEFEKDPVGVSEAIVKKIPSLDPNLLFVEPKGQGISRLNFHRDFLDKYKLVEVD